MQNIELKAHLRDLDRALAVCRRLGAIARGEIRQIDTYFNAPSGRLKLREASPGATELIHYERPDIAGPKRCDYSLAVAPADIKPLLAAALGVRATVAKTRTLFLLENVRIHLDRVDGLGEFIEFEAVLGTEHSAEEGQAKVEELIARFGIAPEELLDYSYLDILLSQTATTV